MKRLFALTAMAALCAAPALAGPKDQSKSGLIGPQALTGNATVNNTTTAFSYQIKGCKLQIKAKGLAGVTDGDVIVCVAGADVIASGGGINPPGGGNSIVVVGEAKSGGLGLKADLGEIGCGGVAAINFNGNLACYLDDAAYRANAGTWQAVCVLPSVPIGNAAVEPTTLKGDPTQNIVVGLCQNFTTLGARITPPPSALIGTQGSYTALAPP